MRLGFAAALLILAAIAAASLVRLNRFADGAQWVNHTHEVIEGLDAVLSRMTEAETAQRGFLLTGDASYLAPHFASRTLLTSRLESVKRLTSDNASQRSRIEQAETIIARRLALLEAGIQARRATAGPLQLPAQHFADGRAAMDGVRRLIADMEREEGELLTTRSASFERDRSTARLIILVGNGVALALLCVSFTVMVKEIRQRKEAELRARRYAIQVEDLYNKAPCGYHSLDHEGLVVQMNETELAWLGYARDEVVGRKRFSELLMPESRARFDANFVKFKRRGVAHNVEYELLCKDGRALPVSLSATLVRDAAGGYLMSRSTLFDITERRQADQRIGELNQALGARAQQLEVTNQELESFSYSVSHDLRSPLRAIDGFSRILEEDHAAALDGEGLRLLGVIRSNTQRMARLIDDLLSFSRLGRQALASLHVRMSALAREAWDQVCDGERTPRLIMGTLPDVVGDPVLLRQVWMNLLSNAVKYSGTRNEPCVEVSARAENGNLIYCVADNGVGFDMRYSDKLFGVFQRLHSMEEFPGTGVGLAIVKRVITRHGGRVWAESVLDQGARFYFSLPEARSDERA